MVRPLQLLSLRLTGSRNLVNLNFDAQRAIQNGLSGTLPTELGNLNKLQSLHVEDNVFSGLTLIEIFRRAFTHF